MQFKQTGLCKEGPNYRCVKDAMTKQVCGDVSVEPLLAYLADG